MNIAEFALPFPTLLFTFFQNRMNVYSAENKRALDGKLVENKNDNDIIHLE
jgi:hypothetical protein